MAPLTQVGVHLYTLYITQHTPHTTHVTHVDGGPDAVYSTDEDYDPRKEIEADLKDFIVREDEEIEYHTESEQEEEEEEVPCPSWLDSCCIAISMP